jgi:hypothetical protein
MVMAFAQKPNTADSLCIRRYIDSLKKLMPIKARTIPITNVEINSALPCPYGCSISGGFLEALSPIKTITDDKESESVCQASAIRPIEPVMIPTQYLNTNNTALVKIDIHPTFSELIRIVFLSC